MAMNSYSDDTKFIELLHTEVLDTLENGNDYRIEIAIVMSLILSEYLLKEALRNVNPLLPYSLARLQSEHGNMALLVKVGPEDTPSARYDDLSILLQRADELRIFPKVAITLIGSLKDARNKIIHDPRHQIDTLVAHLQMIDLFSNHDDIFKNTMNLKISDDDKKSLKEKSLHLENLLSNRLDRKIKRHAEAYKSFSKSEKEERKNKEPLLGSDQFVILDSPMRCPSCYNLTLYYLGSVDYDYDGITTYDWLACVCCDLEMDEYDFDELVTNVTKYTNLKEEDETWSLYYDHKDWQENIYNYI